MMHEEHNNIQQTGFQGIGDHGAPKSLTNGYLLAILFAVGGIGFLVGYVAFRKEYPDTYAHASEKIMPYIFGCVLLVGAYIASSRQRNSRTTHITFGRDHSFFFRTADFTAADVDRVKIRRTLFSDLLSVHVTLKNGLSFRYTCPTETLQHFVSRDAPYVIDARTLRVWPLYIVCLLLSLDCGLFLGSGKSVFLFLFQWPWH